MSLQIKTVAIALVVGLALTLLIQVPDVMRAVSIASLNTSDRFNPNLLSYWFGLLTGVPLLFVIIAILATAWKAGLRNTVVTGLCAVVGVIALSSAITYAVVSVAAALPQKELPFADASSARTSFVKGASESCAQGQKALPQNKSVPAAVIDAYCSCFGNAVADVATRTEVAAMGQRQTTPTLVEKMKTASQKCMRLAQGQQ
jgi:hypothetical protein